MGENIKRSPRRAALGAAHLDIGLYALLSVCSACRGAAWTTSLERAVHDMAPGYRFKAPLSGSADLGRELQKGQPSTNTCFDGDRGQRAPAASLRELSATYEDASSAQLKADFGDILGVPAAATAETASSERTTVTLAELQIETLEGVFLNPTSACATDALASAASEPKGGRLARVITRAIMAGAIDVKASASVIRRLSLDVPGARGGGAASAGRGDSLSQSGIRLYVAEYSECFKVTHETRICQTTPIGSGGGCGVGACSFQVKTYDPGAARVEGLLSCQGDREPRAVAVALGGYAGERTAPGVSYGVRVTSGRGLGAVDVELHLWNVLSVAPDACE